MTIEKRIERLEAKINAIEGDLSYLFESTNPKITKAIREIQEELAKDKNIPVSSFIWRVWNDSWFKSRNCYLGFDNTDTLAGY